MAPAGAVLAEDAGVGHRIAGAPGRAGAHARRGDHDAAFPRPLAPRRRGVMTRCGARVSRRTMSTWTSCAHRRSPSMTQEQVAKAMDWSLSKVIRIETGAVGVSTNDLRALLALYK